VYIAETSLVLDVENNASGAQRAVVYRATSPQAKSHLIEKAQK